MIEFKNVAKVFDNDFYALKNTDLTIKKGTAFGLLGSNGAGKSTMLRLVSGIYQCEEGEVLVDGEKVFDNPLVKSRIFFINDETIQFGGFTLRKLKNFYKGFYPQFSEEDFEKMRQTIDLPLDKKLNQFSKGMKRQAVVIVALACKTDYLMLDEAFDGLDPAMRIIVKRMLVDAMLDRNLTVIISSHNLREISEICDRVAFVHQGEILFSKSIESVQNEIQKVQVVFKNPVCKEDFGELDIVKFEQTGSIYHIIARGKRKDVENFFKEKNPVVLDIIPLNLEEIFVIEMEARGYGYEKDEQ